MEFLRTKRDSTEHEVRILAFSQSKMEMQNAFIERICDAEKKMHDKFQNRNECCEL